MSVALKKCTNFGVLSLLILSAILLIARAVYLYASEPGRFPVNTVKITASYQHITRQQIEQVLAGYSNTSFLLMPIDKLKADLAALNWVLDIQINRVWPDTLKITLVEKSPVAFWGDKLLTHNGQFISVSKEETLKENTLNLLPKLSGPEDKQQEVLHNYQKLSKLLASYGLRAISLDLSDNKSWRLGLENGIILKLGKKGIEKRLLRFCRAYPAVFSDKSEQLVSVDLRYAHGMAVKWNETTNN